MLLCVTLGGIQHQVPLFLLSLIFFFQILNNDVVLQRNRQSIGLIELDKRAPLKFFM